MKYKYIKSFDNGYAIVYTENKGNQSSSYLKGLIDKTGKEIIKPIYSDISSFREGLASVRINIGTYTPIYQYNYIDLSGNIVYNKYFESSCSDFHDGIVVVAARKSSVKNGKEVFTWKYGLITMTWK